MALTLIIGNKNYSSWSLRPWIAMRACGIAFDEVVIPLYEPGSAERIASYTPASKVPVLVDGDLHIWETTAILEHLAERFPEAGLWPAQLEARSVARVVSAEMHAGFGALRRDCPMNMWLPPRQTVLSDEVRTMVSRIDAIWCDCRDRFGKGGPFLFGSFGAADAMYAPVVSRFETYAIEVSPTARAYMDAVRAHPAWKEWRAAALREPWLQKHNEPDWPDVKRLNV